MADRLDSVAAGPKVGPSTSARVLVVNAASTRSLREDELAQVLRYWLRPGVASRSVFVGVCVFFKK